MRIIIIIIAVMLFTGCTKTVYVPISSCPEPPPCGGVLQVKALPKNSSVEQQLFAIRDDFVELYRCKILLDGYRGGKEASNGLR